MPTPDHWDPLPKERQYYRSADTGDLGWLVRRDGKDRIKLDRANQEILRPYDNEKWVEDQEWKPYSRTQVGHFAFDVDLRLCKMIGFHKEAKREWLSLSDEDRIAWLKGGPEPGNLRAEVFSAIMAVLEKHSR